MVKKYFHEVIEEEENRIALVHNGNIINTERIKDEAGVLEERLGAERGVA